MREAKEYYDRAFAKAWAAIDEKVQAYKRDMKISEVRLETVSYDADSHVSRIDELPEDPKAPAADLLEVKVSVEVLYIVVQQITN